MLFSSPRFSLGLKHAFEIRNDTALINIEQISFPFSLWKVIILTGYRTTEMNDRRILKRWVETGSFKEYSLFLKVSLRVTMHFFASETATVIPLVASAQSLSHIWHFAAPQAVSLQAPLSTGFSRDKNTGVGCHFLLQGIFLNQGSNLHLLNLLHRQVHFSPLHPWEAHSIGIYW